MTDFQTPEWVCRLMVSLIDHYPKTVLEPTPGDGNLVKAILNKYPKAKIITPTRFEELESQKVDYVIANPPFSPMSLGYQMLEWFFDFSGNVIVVMPWLSIINSESRTKKYLNKGLKEIIHLPRKAFKGARVQTCILKFSEGHAGDIRLSFAERRYNE